MGCRLCSGLQPTLRNLLNQNDHAGSKRADYVTSPRRLAIGFGCPGDHSIDDIDTENLTQRPNAAHAPRNHYWDPWLADGLRA